MGLWLSMAWEYTIPGLCSVGWLLQWREDRQQSLFGLSLGLIWAEMVIEWLHRARWRSLLQQGRNGPEESPGMDGTNWQHCPLQCFVPLALTVPWGSFSLFYQFQGIWEP